MILPARAMYGLENAVEHGVLESAVSCDKCEILAQKVMLPWNFVYLEYQCNNCKRSLINKNNLDSHKSSTHAAISYSCASMGENPTVRL